MRIAYHPNGASLTDYQLDSYIQAAKANILAAPGVVITVDDPSYPYSFGSVIKSDDRETLGGDRCSRILSKRRKMNMTFAYVSEDVMNSWRDWHGATNGGRVAFVVEEPTTGQIIAVTATVNTIDEMSDFGLFKPNVSEFVEWL